jgi:hypothetical protein
MMEQRKDSSIKLALSGAFCSRTEESVQLIKPMAIETLSIGWLRAMTYRRDGRHNSRIIRRDGMHNNRIVRGWVMDNWDRNERQLGTVNTRRQVG